MSDGNDFFSHDMLSCLEAVDRDRDGRLSPMLKHLVEKLRGEGMTDADIDALLQLAPR